jgi:hypothetical protein
MFKWLKEQKEQKKDIKDFNKKMSEQLIVTYKWLDDETVYTETMDRLGLNNLVVNCWDFDVIKVEKVVNDNE